MSHAANNYVKKLKASPSGEVISVQEKAILWYLADGHNEEFGGVAWPSVSTLASAHALSQRQIRRILSELERKEIIGRISRVRANGSCRSNAFFFVALGQDMEPESEQIRKKDKDQPKAKKTRLALLKRSGKAPKNSGKVVEKGVDETTPPDMGDRVPPGHTRQGTPLTPVTALESLTITKGEESPKDSPLPPKGGNDDYYGGNQTPKTDPKNGTPPLDPPHRGKWDDFKSDLGRQIERLPEKIREGAMGAFSAIRDTTLIGEGCDGDTIEPTWTISATEPQVTHNALQFLWPQVKSALWKAAKGNVVLKVYGGGE